MTPQPRSSFPRCAAPKGSTVRNQLPTDRIGNVREETCKRLLDGGLRSKVSKGDRIGITAGSRDMGGFVQLVCGIVDAVKASGGEPFVAPAMGSHGGAFAEGQLEVLRRLGIREDVVGAPLKGVMETEELGPCSTGAIANLGKEFAAADGIIVLGRTKTHPESSGPIASGLLKMVTIGLGKQRGAQEAHSHKLFPSIVAVSEVTLARARVLFGVAVVENGYRQPVAIEAIPGNYEAFKEADERLLNVAKRYLATLPFKQLDVLVIDEIGKTISGTCMDPHVIGHWRIAGEGERVPDYRRVVALSLTEGSLGNSLGMGAADFTTERLAKSHDHHATYINMLTATEPGSWNSQEACMPVVMPTDRDAIETALYSALASDHPRMVRIKSTDWLSEFWVSEGLLEEVKQCPGLEVTSQSGPLPFSEEGNLL